MDQQRTKPLPRLQKRVNLSTTEGFTPSIPAMSAVDISGLTEEKRRAMRNAIPALKNLIKCFEILTADN